MADLLLHDEPPPRRRRPRWVDALGLVAVVGAMVAIGVVGDREPRKGPSPLPTITTTSVPRPGSADPREAWVDGLPPGGTVGRALTTPTATALLLSGPNRPTLVLEVDTGEVAPILVPHGHAAVGVRDGVLVAAGGRLHRVAGAGGLVVELHPPGAARQLVGAGLVHAWLTSDRGESLLVVELGPDGRPTLRDVTVPSGADVVAGLDDGVVTSQAGLLVYEPADGARRELGGGVGLGGAGHELVLLRCPARCAPAIVDVRSGASRQVVGLPELEVARSGRAVASPDGRWLVVVGYLSPHGDAVRVAIDLPAASAHVLGAAEEGPQAFATRGPTVFALERDVLRAFDVTTGEAHDVRGLDARGMDHLAATPG